MKKYHHKNGFTLIELLVVVAVITLISSIVYASVSSAREKAAYSKSKQELRNLKTAFELSSSSGNYPVQLNLTSSITEESPLFESALSGNIASAPKVSPIIGSSDPEERNYIYLSDGRQPVDGDGVVYSCNEEDENYIVMYKKKVTEPVQLNYADHPFNTGGIVDEFGNKVATSPVFPAYWIDTPDGQGGPNPASVFRVNTNPVFACFHTPDGPTGQEQCEQEYPNGGCVDGCYSVNPMSFTISDPGTTSEVGYYICG